MNTAPRRSKVIDHIKRQITSRILVAGDKLPSIRGLAEKLGVSPSTVTEAYDLLVAEGAILARRGSGFFVANRVQPFAVSQTGPQLNREVDPLWVARQSIDTNDDIEKPGCGWLPAELMPVNALRKAMRHASKTENTLLVNYGSAKGGVNLRRHLARRFHDQGIDVEPDKVLLTGSGSQALDLICRLLLKPGDTVLVDDPCYFNFHALLRAHQISIVSVPYTKTGPDLSKFETVLSEHHPKLYLTNSALHNPTGATISVSSVHRILALAESNDLIIVEDDIFAEFESEPSPRFAALDGLDRVLRIGSFSKTLSASIRCGFIAARDDWIEALADLQVATNFGGPSPLVAEMLHFVLTDGNYRKHMDSLRQKLNTARTQAINRFDQLGISPWITPRGGFYLWCELPNPIDTAILARQALEKGLVLAPGNVFSATQSMTSFMRFNVSQMQTDFCYDVLADLLPQN